MSIMTYVEQFQIYREDILARQQEVDQWLLLRDAERSERVESSLKTFITEDTDHHYRLVKLITELSTPMRRIEEDIASLLDHFDLERRPKILH